MSEAADSNGVVFDRRALDAIRDSLPNGTGVVERLVRTWLRDAPVRLAEARDALLRADVELARLKVHSLKSASATVGAVRLAEGCRAAEAALADGHIPSDSLESITRDLELAVETLSDWVRTR